MINVKTNYTILLQQYIIIMIIRKNNTILKMLYISVKFNDYFITQSFFLYGGETPFLSTGKILEKVEYKKSQGGRKLILTLFLL